MKKTILIAAMFASSAASAEYVQDHYKDVTKRIPHTVEVCEMVEVPIYGQNTFDQSGAIVGGLIGGLLGSQVGGGSGNKAAIGTGAIAGTLIGGKKGGSVIGYRQEQQCRNQTTYEVKTSSVYSHSTVQFTHEGNEYKLRFNK